MKPSEKIILEYKNEYDTYQTHPFGIRGVVRCILNKMPVLRTTDILLEDDIINVKDGYTKKKFEEKCLQHINRYYATKGEITKNTIRPKTKWIELIRALNGTFHYLKGRSELYSFRTLNGYRIKIPYDEKTDDRETILKILAIKDATRAINILQKNFDRERVYKTQANAETYFMERNVAAIKSLRQGLIKAGEKDIEKNNGKKPDKKKGGDNK